LFAVSALLMWIQGLALNRIIYRMVSRLRRDVEEKLHRLPLAYFDRMKRGEILSRVTNDIDNIQNTLMNTVTRSEEHTSELQSRFDLVCRLLLEKKKTD